MAFDGITIANIVTELNQTITGGKINKIAQPENDELIITIKNQRKQYRLFLSASASLPLIYLTETNKPSPLTAPNFCMLLRKHIGSGKIIAIEQPGMERIIRFTIEHLNELGDLCTKYLIVEIMGKHSNIIFCNEEDQIIDQYQTCVSSYEFCERSPSRASVFYTGNTVKTESVSINGRNLSGKDFSASCECGKSNLHFYHGNQSADGRRSLLSRRHRWRYSNRRT